MMTLKELKEKCKAIYGLLTSESRDDKKITEALGELIAKKGFERSAFYVDELAVAILKWGKKEEKNEEYEEEEVEVGEEKNLQQIIDKVFRKKSPCQRRQDKSQSDENEDTAFDLADEDGDFTDKINLSLDDDFKKCNTDVYEKDPDNSKGPDENDLNMECNESDPDDSNGLDEDTPYDYIVSSCGFDEFIDNLPIPMVHRKMLMERYGNNKSSDEIAASFHMPKEIVDEIISRSFEQLKNNLELKEQYVNLGKEEIGCN